MKPDRIRVGADFNGSVLASEVTRIDFDTVDGTVCIVAEFLATQGVTVVDIFPENDPHDRNRIGTWHVPVDPEGIAELRQAEGLAHGEKLE